MDSTTAKHTEFIKIKTALAHQREFDCVGDELFGEGGYAYVVKAKCRKEGKEYAIKLLPYKERTKYNERELEALLKLNLSEESKRNIIEYFHSWVLQVGDKEMLCIQMELCSLDLQKFVYKNRNFAPDITKAQGSPQFYQHVFQQILNGLVVIHSIDWAHRDIHPKNILVVNPDPQQIGDIHIKIADFGVARNVKHRSLELIVSNGTIRPELEQLTPNWHPNLYTAPELWKTTYNCKVDIYSAGIVLYFISLYPENDNQWITELANLLQGKCDIKERLVYDDNQLNTLIKKMLRRIPDERPTAREAKKIMFPDENDSTDSSETQKIKFFVRKEDEQDLHRGYLNDITHSALKAEVEHHTGVRQGQLRQEDMVNGEKKRIQINDDEDVENMFKDAAEKKRDVVLVAIQQQRDDNRTEYQQIREQISSSGSDETMRSV